MSEAGAQVRPKDGDATRASPLQRPVRLGEEVYTVIFGQLMSLRIAPGARITVDSLARDLGVSQTPIREALGRLEAEGLVRKTHLIGYSAAPQLGCKQFEDLYELRLLLEPHAAARAADAMSEKGIAALAALGDRMSVAASGDTQDAYGQFAQLDTEFHHRVADAGGNALIGEALARLHTHVHLFRLMYHARVTEEALAEHAAIVAALHQRDSGGAANAMRTHIERSRGRFAATFGR